MTLPEFNFEALLTFFSQYVYSPEWVYLWVCFFLLAGSFGLPVPEEIILIVGGLVAYMGTRPDLYPPPYDGAPRVDGVLLAILAFLAVIISDTLVYLIGRYLGKKLMRTERFSRILKPQLMEKIQTWSQKYGVWVSGIFRFTPALRLPGFLTCGLLEIPFWKFLLIDGTAALVSVPTQVLLVYWYGDKILAYFKQFKIVVISLVAVALVVFIVKKIMDKRKIKATASL
jgi:membrane protein DedA with SNARE-associated domain